MVYGVYLSAAGALVEEVRQGVIANNLANSSTGGYKSDTAVFRRRLTEALEDPRPGDRSDPVKERLSGGVLLDEVAFSRREGPLIPTGAPLDLALVGDGLFAVSDGRQTLFTRAGSFRRNADGTLTTADGLHEVLGADKKPLRLGPGEAQFARGGEVEVDGQPAGRLLIAGSLDPARFEKVGSSLFRYRGEGLPPPAAAEVLQGHLEGSDVSPVGEMVRLIQSSRAYETNLQMAKIQDGTLGRATAELGRMHG